MRYRLHSLTSSFQFHVFLFALLIGTTLLLRTVHPAYIQYAAVKRMIPVTTSTQLQAALANALPGDVIEVADGNYTGDFVLSKSGTAQDQIVIKAKNRGGAVIAGSGNVQFVGAKYAVLEGFKITSYKYKSVTIDDAQDIRISRNVFAISEAESVTSIWLNVTGTSQHIRIDHNMFEQKKGMGNFIGTDGDGGSQSVKHITIDHNLFNGSSPRVTNGKECVRLGLHQYQFSAANMLVENNIFRNCNGDPEFLSIKTSNNIIRNNTFLTNVGSLVLRHGNNTSVYGNYFLGNDVAGTGGIRIHGEGHSIYNNVFENLTGSANYATVIMTDGHSDYRTVSGSRAPVTNVTIAFNTLVSNTTGIVIGGYGGSTLPRDSIIANNIITGSSGKMISIESEARNFQWVANITYPTSGATVGVPLGNGVRNLNPQLISFNSVMYGLGASSPAINAAEVLTAESFSFIGRDIEGQVRTGVKDIGADEVASDARVNGVLGLDDVGPDAEEAGGISPTQSVTQPPTTMPTTPIVNVFAPAKLTIVYNPPKDPRTNVELSNAQVAETFTNIIYSRSRISEKVAGYKQAGFRGKVYQYIILDAVVAPSGFNSTSTDKTRVCTTAENSFQSFSNSITFEKGDFCRIQASIVNKTSFDHDLNATSPNIVATEDWFLHDTSNNRLHRQSEEGGFEYYPNPANQHMREYFIARIIREMTGGKQTDGTTRAPSGADGIFLDNIGLSWENPKRSGTIKEFSSSTAYADAIHAWVMQIHSSLHSNGRNYPLWGNMIGGNNNGAQWDRYMPYLEGGMLESFAFSWHDNAFSAATMQNQLVQAQRWVQNNNHYLAVAQTTNDSRKDGLYALAAFLLITDGNNGSYFNSVPGKGYNYYHDYPEYRYRLGTPIESFQIEQRNASNIPVKYSREFQCGMVTLDVTTITGTVTLRSNCSAISPTTVLPTTVPGTSASLSVRLHGIGNGGDNVNPTSTGNMNPLRPSRSVSLELFNAANQLVNTKQGTLFYRTATGDFGGIIQLDGVASGAYTARFKTAQFLRKSIPGILTITNGQSINVPVFAVVTGDANNDNALSIFDYNTILDCFSELAAPRNCSDTNKKLMADISDDGNVNQFDYNLFLRELSVQVGE